MTAFEIPTLTTARLRLRAFRAGDLDAYAAMQANPEVMSYLLTGNTATRAEVWRTMATFLGAWPATPLGRWWIKPRVEREIFLKPERIGAGGSRGNEDQIPAMC